MRTLGIDLGTTHTVLCANASVLDVRSGEGTWRLSRGKGLVPTVVAFPPDGRELVGESARLRRVIDPAHTVASSKRLIGRAFTSYAARQWMDRSAVRIGPLPSGGIAFDLRAGWVTPEEIAGRVLFEACRAAAIDPRGLQAVVTVPVGFGPSERRATLSAVRSAGFSLARAIDEPVATAIAYLARSSVRYAVVYDLGGGTFDLAVVDCTSRPFRTLAIGGDPYLGGEDIDHALAEVVRMETLRTKGWDLQSDREAWERLVFEVEAAKIELGREDHVEIDLGNVDLAAPLDLGTFVLTREDLVDIVHDIVRRTFVICDQVLSEAGIRARDVDAVFLAGGSVSLPGLQKAVGDYFGKRPRADLDPLHAVAIGASLAAARPDLSGLLANRDD